MAEQVGEVVVVTAASGSECINNNSSNSVTVVAMPTAVSVANFPSTASMKKKRLNTSTGNNNKGHLSGSSSFSSPSATLTNLGLNIAQECERNFQRFPHCWAHKKDTVTGEDLNAHVLSALLFEPVPLLKRVDDGADDEDVKFIFASEPFLQLSEGKNIRDHRPDAASRQQTEEEQQQVKGQQQQEGEEEEEGLITTINCSTPLRTYLLSSQQVSSSSRNPLLSEEGEREGEERTEIELEGREGEEQREGNEEEVPHAQHSQHPEYHPSKLFTPCCIPVGDESSPPAMMDLCFDTLRLRCPICCPSSLSLSTQPQEHLLQYEDEVQLTAGSFNDLASPDTPVLFFYNNFSSTTNGNTLLEGGQGIQEGGGSSSPGTRTCPESLLVRLRRLHSNPACPFRYGDRLLKPLMAAAVGSSVPMGGHPSSSPKKGSPAPLTASGALRFATQPSPKAATSAKAVVSGSGGKVVGSVHSVQEVEENSLLPNGMVWSFQRTMHKFLEDLSAWHMILSSLFPGDAFTAVFDCPSEVGTEHVPVTTEHTSSLLHLTELCSSSFMSDSVMQLLFETWITLSRPHAHHRMITKDLRLGAIEGYEFLSALLSDAAAEHPDTAHHFEHRVVATEEKETAMWALSSLPVLSRYCKLAEELYHEARNKNSSIVNRGDKEVKQEPQGDIATTGSATPMGAIKLEEGTGEGEAKEECGHQRHISDLQAKLSVQWTVGRLYALLLRLLGWQCFAIEDVQVDLCISLPNSMTTCGTCGAGGTGNVSSPQEGRGEERIVQEDVGSEIPVEETDGTEAQQQQQLPDQNTQEESEMRIEQVQNQETDAQVEPELLEAETAAPHENGGVTLEGAEEDEGEGNSHSGFTHSILVRVLSVQCDCCAACASVFILPDLTQLIEEVVSLDPTASTQLLTSSVKDSVQAFLSQVLPWVCFSSMNSLIQCSFHSGLDSGKHKKEKVTPLEEAMHLHKPSCSLLHMLLSSPYPSHAQSSHIGGAVSHRQSTPNHLYHPNIFVANTSEVVGAKERHPSSVKEGLIELLRHARKTADIFLGGRREEKEKTVSSEDFLTSSAVQGSLFNKHKTFVSLLCSQRRPPEDACSTSSTANGEEVKKNKKWIWGGLDLNVLTSKCLSRTELTALSAEQSSAAASPSSSFLCKEERRNVGKGNKGTDDTTFTGLHNAVTSCTSTLDITAATMTQLSAGPSSTTTTAGVPHSGESTIEDHKRKKRARSDDAAECSAESVGKVDRMVSAEVQSYLRLRKSILSSCMKKNECESNIGSEEEEDPFTLLDKIKKSRRKETAGNTAETAHHSDSIIRTTTAATASPRPPSTTTGSKLTAAGAAHLVNMDEIRSRGLSDREKVLYRTLGIFTQRNAEKVLKGNKAAPMVSKQQVTKTLSSFSPVERLTFTGACTLSGTSTTTTTTASVGFMDQVRRAMEQQMQSRVATSSGTASAPSGTAEPGKKAPPSQPPPSFAVSVGGGHSTITPQKRPSYDNSNAAGGSAPHLNPHAKPFDPTAHTAGHAGGNNVAQHHGTHSNVPPPLSHHAHGTVPVHVGSTHQQPVLLSQPPPHQSSKGLFQPPPLQHSPRHQQGKAGPPRGGANPSQSSVFSSAPKNIGREGGGTGGSVLGLAPPPGGQGKGKGKGGVLEGRPQQQQQQRPGPPQGGKQPPPPSGFKQQQPYPQQQQQQYGRRPKGPPPAQQQRGKHWRR